MTTTLVREVTLKYRGQKRKVSLDVVSSPYSAADFIRRVLPDNVREHFVVLFLNAAHCVSGFYIAATGTALSCPIAMREVFQPAVMAGAVSIICGHNHPGNSVTPSAEDRLVTEALSKAGDLLGIPLLDHVIVSADSHYSFKEDDTLPLRSKL